MLRGQGQEWLPDEDHVDLASDEFLEDLVQLIGCRVRAGFDHDGLSRNVAELAQTAHEPVPKSGLGRFVG